uniref:Putative secreted protein n=1 Tax=Ixodes ricinus TaxID=34613 RepID=A0A6B0UL15_IXORI
MRYVMCFMISLGVFLVYSMRVNLSVTIIAMVNTTAIDANSTDIVNMACPVPSNQTSPDDPKKVAGCPRSSARPGYSAEASESLLCSRSSLRLWRVRAFRPSWCFGHSRGSLRA